MGGMILFCIILFNSTHNFVVCIVNFVFDNSVDFIVNFAPVYDM